MYNIEFYQTSSGHCDVFEFLENLRIIIFAKALKERHHESYKKPYSK